MFFHDIQKLAQKFFYQTVDLLDLIPAVQLHVQSHLVIAAAPCVKAFARLPDPLDQIRFHKGMDIFMLL